MASGTVEIEVRLRRARLVRATVVLLWLASRLVPRLRRSWWHVVVETGPARLTPSRRFVHPMTLRLRRGKVPAGQAGAQFTLDTEVR